MGLSAPHLLFGKVMHGRLFPKINRFTYGIYYLALPLSQLNDMSLPYNRIGLLSFYDSDHGECDGSNLEDWARNILADYNLSDSTDGEIILICMPRVLGYVFNPVSFWLCYDKVNDLRAVISEVHNTFGERHAYICAHEDNRVIKAQDIMQGEKIFHVSPFLQREGSYQFRFQADDKKFSAMIDFYDGSERKQLVTSLIGKFSAMQKLSLRKAFWKYPLVTFKAVGLIHWQALKLVIKGIKYIHRPKQSEDRVSRAGNLTKF